ncbi:MAG: putative lipid II flippase FtsW [Pseudohongiellaceae bacterium]
MRMVEPATQSISPSARWLDSAPNRLLVLLLTFLAFGILMMTSASVEVASSQYGDPFFFTRRQLFFSVVGLVAVFITVQVPLRVWYQNSGLMLLAVAFLLLLVLIPGVGTVVNGSARWIDLGFYRLQPSELGKIFLVIYMAAFLQRRHREVREDWSGFVKPVAVIAAMALMLQLEPDHGAMVIVVAAGFGMLFLGGARLHRFLLVVLLGVLAIVGLALTRPYVISRLTSFLNPWASEYVYGEGYQLTQALIAFGRGEWFGAGLGNSLQKLYFLPEAHTDFVVAIIAEELGVPGILLVIVLFSLLVATAMRTGRKAERYGQRFGAFVAYGIAILFSSQAFINLGVNTGLLPTKGLTLPFFSYGGNSLLASCFMVALLMRIQYETALAGRQGGGR